MQLSMLERGKQNWAFHIRAVLNRNGFGDVWLQQGVGCRRRFICTFRQRLIDQFQQGWSSSVGTKERFEVYSSFKYLWMPEKYVDFLKVKCFRQAYVKFRFGVSPIHVHTMRYRSDVLPRHLRCPLCKEEIEDEVHVLLVCKGYKDLRRNVSIFTELQDLSQEYFVQLMSATDEETVRQLARFLFKIFRRREQIIELGRMNMEQ